MASTHAISLDPPDIHRLETLTDAYPGATTHLALIALVRIGIEQVTEHPDLLGREISLIQAARKERRRAQAPQPEGDSDA